MGTVKKGNALFALKQSWGIAIIAVATGVLTLGLSAAAGTVSIAHPDAGTAESAGALPKAPDVGGENVDRDADWAYAPGVSEVRFSDVGAGPVKTGAHAMIPANGIEEGSRLPYGPQNFSSTSTAFYFDHPDWGSYRNEGKLKDDDSDRYGRSPRVLPEPSSMTLLGMGLSGFILHRFRKRQG